PEHERQIQMRGNITKRGKASWRLKLDIDRDPTTGKHRIRYVTVRGTKAAAQAELARLVAAHDEGEAVGQNGRAISATDRAADRAAPRHNTAAEAETGPRRQLARRAAEARRP